MKTTSKFFAGLCCLFAASWVQAQPERADVLVYGGTPAGIAAALAASKHGHSVILVEPYRRVGGLVTNGLSHTDFRTFEGMTGTFLDFTRRVQEYYARKYGVDSPQAKGCFRGTHAEPHVNLAVLEAMLRAQPKITVLTQTRLERVKRDAAGKRIVAAEFRLPDKKTRSLGAEIFIDATYEGDLLALAKVPYRVGREARSEYGESLAPEKADTQVQGYNFRFCMTRDPKERVPAYAPPGYRREDFVDVVPLLRDGKIKAVFGIPGAIYKAQLPPLPNAKHDINDVSNAHVFTEKDTAYAAGDVRSILHKDAIAYGDYGPNCHGTAHEGPRFGGRHTGEFYKPVAPYQIPYGVLVAKEIDNLLVPVACSSSHVGFCALRLEPIWSALGAAAGTAAHVALVDKAATRKVAVAKVQNLLHAAGAGTIYTNDVLPGHKDFTAVHWWGCQGGLHGLSPTPDTPGQRGKQITGQYFEAYPGHAVELDAALDDALRARWLKLASSAGVDVTTLRAARTRGEFLRGAFAGRAK